MGAVYAVSAETGRTPWTREQRAVTMALAATGGGFMIVRDVNGSIYVAASTGLDRIQDLPPKAPRQLRQQPVRVWVATRGLVVPNGPTGWTVP